MNDAQSEIEILLNDFAIRCFRDVADADYIAARLAYRSGLYAQFSWAGLQACEKYLKAIFLLNRIPSNRVGHSLSEALELMKKLPFEIELSESSREMINYLDIYGGDRYLVFSYVIHGPKLPQLDKLVCELRRYCRVLDYSIVLQNGEETNMLSLEIARIKKSPNAEHLTGGFLEQVIGSSRHPAREPLLWKNMFFGKVKRKRISMRTPMQGVNSPLTLRPWLLEHVEKYVRLPNAAKKAFIAEADNQT